ncbi:class I SAM-dependent methyltransferase [Synechococcus sp. Tobar12-5m-g]|uniref:class I SAM-dependent methyltransferase n=1 Tax=unclassified Synechococcus TaxID=2626047 RepID=UPI0020CFC66B|nr:MULTISPECIES: class I SAM-dependent methyltransferase [unclassified Synechococcus]MCP9772584.1 class I SAM-dependent methyltransferase [Synechococcus sp. Tobar12-5m-g]MCP9873423.1 class I SAM-dependent methyltransferase [Synechococcus sp. Cruz CV-v-12]
MKPTEIGAAYNMIASWWHAELQSSSRGLAYVERAIGLCTERQRALDVGCGTGGRIVAALVNGGFDVTGIDVSQEMLRIAKNNHSNVAFLWADACEWEPPGCFDIITAWDSLIHVPHGQQRIVVEKLCHALARQGVILITVGGTDGVVMGKMQDVSFYHSSLNDHDYLEVMKAAGCRCILLERDQWPEEHTVLIAKKS